MYAVHFFNDSNLILSQYRKNLPAVKEELKIKGHWYTVLNVSESKTNVYQVQLMLQKETKRRRK